MKSLRNLLIIGFASTILLTSCTMEKRLYMPGYHTEWNANKHNPDKQLVIDKTADKDQTPVFEELQTSASALDKYVAPIVTENNLTASIDNPVVFPSHKPVALLNSEKTMNVNENSLSVAKTLKLTKKEIKNKVREFKESQAYTDGSGSFALRLIGWVLIVAGLISLFLVANAIWVGVVIMLLGLVFVVVGRRR